MVDFEGDPDYRWFPSDGSPNTSVEQQRFEHELYRALVVARDHFKSPVIRCSEKMFMTFMRKDATTITAARWSVYMYRGVPVALRGNHDCPDVVEVLDDTGGQSTVFRMEGFK